MRVKKIYTCFVFYYQKVKRDLFIDQSDVISLSVRPIDFVYMISASAIVHSLMEEQNNVYHRGK